MTLIPLGVRIEIVFGDQLFEKFVRLPASVKGDGEKDVLKRVQGFKK